MRDNNQIYEDFLNRLSSRIRRSLNEMAAYAGGDVQVGDTIRIISMDDSNGKDMAARRMSGKTGTVTKIDDMGQLHGTWGTLAIIPEIDEFEIIG